MFRIRRVTLKMSKIQIIERDKFGMFPPSSTLSSTKSIENIQKLLEMSTLEKPKNSKSKLKYTTATDKNITVKKFINERSEKSLSPVTFKAPLPPSTPKSSAENISISPRKRRAASRRDTFQKDEKISNIGTGVDADNMIPLETAALAHEDTAKTTAERTPYQSGASETARKPIRLKSSRLKLHSTMERSGPLPESKALPLIPVQEQILDPKTHVMKEEPDSYDQSAAKIPSSPKKRKSRRKNADLSKEQTVVENNANLAKSRRAVSLNAGQLTPPGRSPQVRHKASMIERPAEDSGETHKRAKNLIIEELHIAKNIKEWDKTVTIHIEKSDTLFPTVDLRQVAVMTHFVDARSGEYLRKADRGLVVHHYSDLERKEYIPPMRTKPLNMTRLETKAPHWNEKIKVNERYMQLLQPETILFFEVVDLAPQQYYRDEVRHLRIAWGFLKLLSANGKPNTDKKARIQLYKYPIHLARLTDLPHTPLVYQCWRNELVKYPSTLYLSVNSDIAFPMEQSRQLRPGERPEYNILTQSGPDTYRKSLLAPIKPTWRRKPHEISKIPNRLLYRITGGRQYSILI